MRKQYDSYVKGLLEEICKDKFVTNGSEPICCYNKLTAHIDGVINNCCAVEIESREPKQIRGALVDLLQIDYRKKLLILVPTTYLRNADVTKKHCEYILKNFRNKLKRGKIKSKVVILKGKTKGDRKKRQDIKIIKSALKQLKCLKK